MTISYIDTAVAPGGDYTYAVEAVNSAGASAESATEEIVLPVPPPSPPINLAAYLVQAASVALKWKAVTGAVSYGVYRNGVLLGTVAAPAVIYTDATTQPLTTYAYQVSVTTASGTSALSAPISVTTPDAVPAIPTNLVASAITQTTLTLTCDAVADASSYQFFQDGTALGAPVAVPTLAVTGLTANTGYGFGVYAINAIGHSGRLTITAKTAAAPGPPPVPTGLAATAITANSVTLTCNDSAGATEYIFWVSGTALAPTTQPTLVVTGLPAAHSFTSSVQAGNAAGTSVKSATISYKTAAS